MRQFEEERLEGVVRTSRKCPEYFRRIEKKFQKFGEFEDKWKVCGTLKQNISVFRSTDSNQHAQLLEHNFFLREYSLHINRPVFVSGSNAK